MVFRQIMLGRRIQYIKILHITEDCSFSTSHAFYSCFPAKQASFSKVVELKIFILSCSTSS